MPWPHKTKTYLSTQAHANIHMNFREFFELYHLSRRRLQSEKDYRAFQAFQARQMTSYFVAQNVTIQNKQLLDLGSGIGGYSLEFAQVGAQVISVDLVQPCLTRTGNLKQIQGSAISIPLRDESVDMVFCASLIEHVARPDAVLKEIERVLKPGGVAYVSFPPYYNPTGGHEFAPFHYLGERFAMRLVRRRAVVPQWLFDYYHLPEQADSFARLSQGWGLYRMTLRRFRRLLAATHLKCVNVSTRYLPISFVKWPVLGELFTWHAQFLVMKR